MGDTQKILKVPFFIHRVHLVLFKYEASVTFMHLRKMICCDS